MTLIGQGADGSVRLAAGDADLHGNLQYELGGGKDNIGFWTNPDDTASWTFKLDRPGKFGVMTDIAAENSGKFEVIVGSQILAGAAPVTRGYTDFEPTNLSGTLDLAAGDVTLSVKPVADGWQPMNLKFIQLKAVEANP